MVMKAFHFVSSSWVLVLAVTLLAGAAIAQPAEPTLPQQRALVTQGIDERALATLRGNTRPEANAINDRGPVADDFRMEHMLLQLRRSPEQERALDQFIDQLHNPKSPNFHRWLTARQFGERYGLARADLDTVSGWLRSHGLVVNVVYSNGVLIDFSGTASQVNEAFHTEIHHLEVDGVKHFANMSDPQIPAALTPIVLGVVSMNDFRPHPMYQPHSQFTVGNGNYLLVPPDLATIYNFNPLFAAGTSGQGQTIVVIEDTNVQNAGDWNTFRTKFGLAAAFPSATFSTVHPPSSGTNNCSNPGVNGAEVEAMLDAEWASAAAPSAAIVLASCSDTTTFGGLIAFQNLISASTTPPAVISISYGTSESLMGAAGNAAFNSAYQQAVTEGVSIFVSAGDQAAAVSDRGNASATHGINVNGFGSTIYNVAVGGTDFGDTFAGTNSTYWSATNGTTFGSALSYIPEIPWNDSCASTLIATFVTGFPITYGTFGFCNNPIAIAGGALNVVGGSGGPSRCSTGAPSTAGVVSGTCAGYAKPSWQSVVGNPSDGVRDLPDVSLFSASGVWGHAYVVCDSSQAPCTGTPDTWVTLGGTSVAAPIMAGLQALINQATSSRSGNPNPVYYSLAAGEYGASGNASCNSTLGNGVGTTCIFYDVTQGDMDVPCQGSLNCFLPSGTFGVLSTSNVSYQPAYATKTGWDFATGIGTVNASNLVKGYVNNTGFLLSVTLAGTGSGSVGSTPAGIACPGTCSAKYTSGTMVTLTATAASGSTFTGWSGACTGTGSCAVTMSAAKSVTATFNAVTFQLSVTLAGTGSGTVSSTPAGINCPGTCSTNFNSGTSVMLNPTAASGSSFAGWSGACTGTGSCSVTMSAAKSVTATFTLLGGSPLVTLSPASLTFSGQLLGTTSVAKTVKLTNSGTGALTITSLTASGDFGGTHTCPLSPSTLAPNASCSMNLTFTPSAPGSIPGEITIADNAGGFPHLVNLSGTGLTAISLSPTSLPFGTVIVGTTSAAKTLTLTNNLSTALTIGFSASGDYTAVGSGASPCGVTLAGKAKCTMGVTFSPKSNGSINGVVTVTYNSTFSPQQVALSGTGSGGAASALTFSPSSLTFAAQLIGTTSASKTVTVTNSSGSPVNISGISAIGNYAAVGAGVTPCGGSLAALAKCTIAVTFVPSINGTIKGAVAFTDNTAVSPQIYNVSGTGVLPLSYSPASLTFAAQAVGTSSAPKTVTLTNNQSTALTLAFAATGQYAAIAGGTTPCGSTLAAKAKCTLTVTFSPAAVGTIKGVVTFGYTGSFSPVAMKLTGTGQ
jgi:hypothetical protein